MNATIVDALFVFVAGACAAFLTYGGWLCLRHGRDEEDVRRHQQRFGHGSKKSPICGVMPIASIAVLAVGIATIGTAETHAATIFEEAMQDYESGEYVKAHVKFRIAAEKGDARAQEILGLMYALGPQLYPGVAQNLCAAATWLDRAARSGKPTARYAYCAFARKEFPARTQRWKCFDWVAETGQPGRLHSANVISGR